MDNLSTLNVFVCVAETRSFVATGRVLGVSASAVGKSIVRLEERFGVRLFNRSTRSVTLTEDGRRFLERSRRILAEIAAAEAEFLNANTAPSGRLKISLPLIGEPFLQVLANFKKTYPAVDLDLTFDDRRVDIIEEGYDAVLRSGEVPDSGLTSRHLGEYKMILVGSPDYFLQHGAPQHVNDLLQHACIQFRFPNTGKLQVWPLRIDQQEIDLQLPISMVCNNLEARLSFAVQGIGIACLPDFAIRKWLDCGKLVRILHGCSDSGTFKIMWPSGKHPALKLRVFIDFVKTHLFPEESR
ncbi:LysR family transcriptional regulator [Pseudomonas sp. 10B1]|uniref:LysR family transcriptional regulator n=1 Tax=unclassified Pseudomonas TaxID=196821 RepID=UPI002AB55EB9|nr:MULTISPECIES: LysR family transcriptional regulator [unclassified Pseudomonas]MDY7559851.1 LysR family transcriptional regulator [Pseudomonas sp. AB6]MEA9977861.1 LysR family transcriptional regulator [Pseudomonas sp. RTS4]MEA9992906.1 LysR family transcriptional regulator [Pseudomonas sp. AA4]MEB0089081.1 LysR family transcriptional regulator [Pseudomonas sp. RTI1]MEB0125716.1 LysR family transcriptional regulator [Pseudomonas sp. CCC1.2]